MIVVNSVVDSNELVQTTVSAQGSISMQQIGALKQSINLYLDNLLVIASKATDIESTKLIEWLAAGQYNSIAQQFKLNERTNIDEVKSECNGGTEQTVPEEK